MNEQQLRETLLRVLDGMELLLSGAAEAIEVGAEMADHFDACTRPSTDGLAQYREQLAKGAEMLLPFEVQIEELRKQLGRSG